MRRHLSGVSGGFFFSLPRLRITPLFFGRPPDRLFITSENMRFYWAFCSVCLLITLLIIFRFGY
jgi:hypothetical protein